MALSTTQKISESCSESLVKKLLAWGGRAAVSDWVKVLVTVVFSGASSVAGVWFLTWNLLQDHERKLEGLNIRMLFIKEQLDGHTQWHKAQYDTIEKKLTEIQVDIGRIQGARDGR